MDVIFQKRLQFTDQTAIPSHLNVFQYAYFQHGLNKSKASACNHDLTFIVSFIFRENAMAKVDTSDLGPNANGSADQEGVN